MHINDEKTGDLPAKCQEVKIEAISRFSINLSHKLNNYLTSVINYIFIIKSLKPDDSRIQHIEKIEHILDNAKQLLHDLIDMSSPSGAALSKIILNDFLKENLSAYINDAGKKGVHIIFESPDSITVTASKKGLINIITNLLENAIEAGATEISIIGRETKKISLITIKDNGGGIKEKHYGMIFEPFHTTKPSGNGLGLYLVYNLVKSFGGDIWYSSRENRGTEFIISLQKETPIR